jgi:hypothetical protein
VSRVDECPPAVEVSATGETGCLCGRGLPVHAGKRVVGGWLLRLMATDWVL